MGFLLAQCFCPQGGFLLSARFFPEGAKSPVLPLNIMSVSFDGQTISIFFFFILMAVVYVVFSVLLCICRLRGAGPHGTLMLLYRGAQ